MRAWFLSLGGLLVLSSGGYLLFSAENSVRLLVGPQQVWLRVGSAWWQWGEHHQGVLARSLRGALAPWWIPPQTLPPVGSSHIMTEGTLTTWDSGIWRWESEHSAVWIIQSPPNSIPHQWPVSLASDGWILLTSQRPEWLPAPKHWIVLARPKTYQAPTLKELAMEQQIPLFLLSKLIALRLELRSDQWKFWTLPMP